MKCSNPYKLIKRLLPSLESMGGSFGIQLSKTNFRLSFIEKDEDNYSYRIEVIKAKPFGLDTPDEILSTQVVTVPEEGAYETMSSWLVESLPKYTVLHEGLESTALCNLVVSTLYIFEEN